MEMMKAVSKEGVENRIDSAICSIGRDLPLPCGLRGFLWQRMDGVNAQTALDSQLDA